MKLSVNDVSLCQSAFHSDLWAGLCLFYELCLNNTHDIYINLGMLDLILSSGFQAMVSKKT